MKYRQRGVSLVELMIALVVVSILASIAIPSYRQYLLRAQRSDAKTMMLRVQTALEKRFLQQGTFTTNLTAVPPTGLGLSSVSERGFYNLVVALTATGYTVTATPVAGGSQVDDRTCATYTINESSTKRAFNNASVDKTTECWR
ncbi:MAG TPA: type IV pilin protein [Steroidobacteraceae bacterium]|nr:type IV pilin protein [Steroidobacteraceae bacterium]